MIALAGALMGALSSTAAVDRVLVLAVLEGEVAVQSGEAASAIQEAALARVGLHVYSREEEFLRWGQDGAANARKECGSDRACLSRHVRAADARFAVLLTIDREADLLSLRLLDARAERVAGTESGAIPETPLSAAITELAGRLFDSAGYQLAARLVVDVQPRGALVTVSGRLTSSADPHVARVAPGAHRVELTLEGHEPHALELTLAPGETKELSIAMIPIPSLVERPAFWIVMGSAAATAIGIGVAAALIGGESCACLTVAGTPCFEACSPTP